MKAHDDYLKLVREGAATTDYNGDAGTHDLLVSQVMRTHELQTWFVSSGLAQAK